MISRLLLFLALLFLPSVSAHAQLSVDTLLTIGDEESAGAEYLFGQISGFARADDGRMFVSDVVTSDVRVYDASGEFVTHLGTRGEGPGEFERAQSLFTVEDQWLLVGNAFRIEVFDISGEMIFNESVQLQRPVNDLCAVGNKLYVHSMGFTDDDKVSGENYRQMLHAYSLQSFDHLFSFGQSYRSSNPMAIERMSTGALSCNKASSMVLFAFERMNVIQGYSAENGSLKWVTRIDDFNLPAITESIRDGRPTMSYGIPESGIMDIVSAPVEIDKEFMTLQILRTPLSSPDDRSYHTFVLNSENGTGSYLNNEIPEISDYFDGYIVSRGVSNDLMISQVYRIVSEQ